MLNSRQPGSHIWLMVIMEMVKEFTGREALIAKPHQTPVSVNSHLIGQACNEGKKLLMNLIYLVQDFAQ